MDYRVREMNNQLPSETLNDIFAITGGCRIDDRGICENCRMIEEAYNASQRKEKSTTK